MIVRNLSFLAKIFWKTAIYVKWLTNSGREKDKTVTMMGEIELSSLEKTMRYHVEREFESHLPKLVRLDLKLFYIIITNYVNKSPTCVLIGFSNKYLCWHRVTGQNFYEDKWHMLKISRNTPNGVYVKFGKSIRVFRNYFSRPVFIVKTWCFLKFLESSIFSWVSTFQN